jgi:hypothetical protein
MAMIWMMKKMMRDFIITPLMLMIVMTMRLLHEEMALQLECGSITQESCCNTLHYSLIFSCRSHSKPESFLDFFFFNHSFSFLSKTMVLYYDCIFFVIVHGTNVIVHYDFYSGGATDYYNIIDCCITY